MLKWFLISFVTIIVIIVALVGTLYYLIFVKDVALERDPFTYDSEEAAVASGISSMLDGLLGITLDVDQQTELEEIIAGIKAETHELEDLTTFIADPDTGVMFNNQYNITGRRSLNLGEKELTALINLMIGSMDAFDFDVEGLSSEDDALAYDIGGEWGNVKLSGIGVNINENDIAMVFTVTLPESPPIPVVGSLLGGRQISIGLNPTMKTNIDGSIVINANLDGIKIGGISASWPGVSYLTNYLKDMEIQGQRLEEKLTSTFNITDQFNSVFDRDLGLEFAVLSGQLTFLGPEPEERRAIDYGDSTREDVAKDARDAIAAFEAGDTLELSEEDLTALMAESIEDELEGADLGLDTDSLVVNVDDGVLSLTTTMIVPEDASEDLGIPAGSEADVDIETAVVIDEEGNATLVIEDITLGGVSSTDLGFDVSEINEALEGSGVDLATALGLPEGSLTTADMEGGTLTLE